MKYRTVARWNRSHQARTVSAAARELVAKLLDTAGPLDHRYADGRMVAVLYKGQRALAEEMRMSVSGIKARMRTLEKAGIIARHRRAQGRNSITVVELLTEPQPLKSQDLPRRTHPCPTVGHTLVPPTDTPLSESSSSESSLSERNPLSHDYDARVLSAVCDAAAGRTATAPPPPGINVQAVRRMLTTLGVNPQTLLTIEGNHKPETIAAVVQAVALVKRDRPKSKALNNQAATGAMIGGILLKGNQFPAWMREAIENANAPAEMINRTLDRLEAADLIADR